jgi:hypothetical protein
MIKEHVIAHVQALRQDLLERALDGVKVGGDLAVSHEALLNLTALDRLLLFLVRKIGGN